MNDYINPNDPQYMAETDSQSIQNAINAAEKGGCRTVIIPRRCERTGQDEWMIDKTILLPSNITVILDDCHLTQVEGVYENIFRNKNMYTDVSLKLEGRQRGIRIIGRGEAILDGGKGNDLLEKDSQKDGKAVNTLRGWLCALARIIITANTSRCLVKPTTSMYAAYIQEVAAHFTLPQR